MTKPGNPSYAVSAWVRKRDFEKLTDMAKREGVTRAAIIRRAIEKYLDGWPKPLVSPGRPWELDDD